MHVCTSSLHYTTEYLLYLSCCNPCTCACTERNKILLHCILGNNYNLYREPASGVLRTGSSNSCARRSIIIFTINVVTYACMAGVLLCSSGFVVVIKVHLKEVLVGVAKELANNGALKPVMARERGIVISLWHIPLEDSGLARVCSIYVRTFMIHVRTKVDKNTRQKCGIPLKNSQVYRFQL